VNENALPFRGPSDRVELLRGSGRASSSSDQIEVISMSLPLPPPRPCASIPAWRRLHVAPDAARFPAHLEGDGCRREVRGRFSSAKLGFVVTWSLGSREAVDPRRSRFGGMAEMRAMYSSRADVGLQIYARGASCSQLTPDLAAWVATGRGACVDGPNLGAREAHTVLRFAEEFYAHLPEVVVFTQDDPEVHFLRRPGPASSPAGGPVGSDVWAHELKASFESRRLAASAGAVDPHNESVPWQLGVQPCLVDVERGFTSNRYGVYRPMHWWLRSFLHPFVHTGSAEAPPVSAPHF